MYQRAVVQRRKTAEAVNRSAATAALQQERARGSSAEHRSDRKNDRPSACSVPPIVDDVLRTSGQPLNAATRAFMEPRFGHDLSAVRIHTDFRAADSARRVYARAYTVGPHIVFGTNQFAPSTQQGRELLAHELAHTIQQRGAGRAPLSVAADTSSERSAEAAAREVASGYALSTALPVRPPVLACAPVPIDAYPDDLLAKELDDVQRRLKSKSYEGRDRDINLRMKLQRESELRGRTAAVAEAQAVASPQTPEPPRQQPHPLPAKFLPGGFTDEDIDPGSKQRAAAEKAHEEQVALDRKRDQEDEKGRAWRLAVVRSYLTRHGVMKWDMADTLSSYLTVNDLRVLRQNGLDPPGFWTTHYAERVIEVIDKIVPRDPMMDQADIEDLRRRASEINRVAAKIEGVANEGPHALGGRIVGAVTGKIIGADPLWSSEVGAAFGSLAGAGKETQAWAMASTYTPADEPVRSEVTNMESESQRKPIAASDAPQPLSSGSAGLTFPRGVDVTRAGPFPTAKQPARTVEEFQKQGGVVTRYPEGHSGVTPKTPTRLKPDPMTARPTGSRTPRDEEILAQPGMRTQYKAYPGPPQHHVFPQELKKWFEQRFRGTSENIHDYTIYLSEGEHQAIHVSRKGGVLKGQQQPDLTGWNQEWKDYKRDHPNATPQMIFEEAGRLMDKYKISMATIDRYKDRKK